MNATIIKRIDEMEKMSNLISVNENSRKEIKISIGSSRFSKSWKRKTMTWGAFVERLKTPTVTQETYDEYRKMSKAKQGDIKDVGGFVGGSINGTQRLNTKIISRSLITLDLDDIKGQTALDIAETIELFLGCEAVLYSTHSHTEKRPRLRLIIPTDREMTPDEYEPVARKVAEASSISLDFFDDTTYEASRLMYWPSHSRDQEPFFKHLTGHLVEVDKVLNMYEDWRDILEWPTSSRQNTIIERARAKQEDPLEKSGLIGAFCRTYTIQEAIDKYLQDIYVPTGQPDRYSYKKGSTVGGLVIYDDKFAYSHHGTDPVSKVLCNAFDLVRLQLYGRLDEEAKPNTPVNRLPSYKKMLELIQKDPTTSQTITKEKLKDVKDDFEFEEDKSAWMAKLKYTQKGAIENQISNIITILNNDPNLKGKLKYDEFANRATVLPGVPWGVQQVEHDWQDVDDSGLHNYLESVYGLRNMGKVEDAKNLVFEANSFHPVKDYLNSLPDWDGVSRIPTIFQDYLGAEDDLYTREVAKVHFTAAIKRIYEPGCKYDTMVILSGEQGIGKSTFISILAKGWFSDSLYTIKGKEAAELIQGVWHIELGEMSAMRKADRDAVKAFLSKSDDQYRIAYARNTSRFPRQCVFWGTSNEYNFLRDPTGDRRSFPIRCGITKPTKDIFRELPKEVDQIWKEAEYLYKKGQKTYLVDEALRESIEVQERHKEDTPWRGIIMEYLEADYPANWDELKLYQRRSYIKGEDVGLKDYSDEKIKLNQTCALQIWCEVFDGKKQNLNRYTTMQINDILTSIPGWEREENVMRVKPYGPQRGFKRIEKEEK